MSYQTDHRHQKALYWENAGTDPQGERVVAAEPDELMVRWVERRRDVTDGSGNKVTILATVILDRRVKVGSMMWRGGIDCLPGTATVPEDDVMEVVFYRETPDIDGRNHRRTADLARWGSTIPATSEG